jgi:hypothetical protein
MSAEREGATMSAAVSRQAAASDTPVAVASHWFQLRTRWAVSRVKTPNPDDTAG